jgi:hypothetical protein
MYSGRTFRDYINSNKKKVLEYLVNKDYTPTNEIMINYTGEKDIYQVRKSLKELEKEGLIKSTIPGFNFKYWKLNN